MLGWIKTDAGPLYLHAGGAIGADGASDVVQVEVNGLDAYALPPPPAGQGLQEAIEARLRVGELAKGGSAGAAIVAAVLQALPARAVLGPTNYTVHFGGITGSRKTTCGVVALGSFGRVPPRGKERLTTTWASTVNGIQRILHDGGDTLIGIDELTNEAARARAKEFVMAQGDLKVRDRMDRERKFEPGFHPRGSPLSTGERILDQTSELARMLNCLFTPGMIDDDTLGEIQKDVYSGLHAACTSAYVQWLATDGRLERERAALDDRAIAIEADVKKSPATPHVHDRTPLAIADLVAGYEVFLRFTVDVGAIEQVTADAYRQSVFDGLVAIMDNQQDVHEGSKPENRFLESLRAGIQSRQWHLANTKDMGIPGIDPAICGWDSVIVGRDKEGFPTYDWRLPTGSKRVGYVDTEDLLIYLIPDQTLELARSKGQAAGVPFENPKELAANLDAAGLLLTSLENGKRQRTQKKRICGQLGPRYLTLAWETVFGVPTTE